MEKSDIIFRLWDANRNSRDFKVLDAVQVIGSSTSDDTMDVPTNTESVNLSTIDIIKAWGGYTSESVSDSDLLKYLGIEAKYIPSWFKNNYPHWVISEQVSQHEFIDSARYLHEKGIIK